MMTGSEEMVPAFPLTPALSLRERENRSAASSTMGHRRSAQRRTA